MLRFVLVMFGLALVAICAGWFTGMLSDYYYNMLGFQAVEAPVSELGETAVRKAKRAKRFIGGLDVNTVLNFANAIIGFVGLVVTYRASRNNSNASNA